MGYYVCFRFFLCVPSFLVVFFVAVQVNHHELDGDWFQSIRDKLNWNARNMQKPLNLTAPTTRGLEGQSLTSAKSTPFIRDSGQGEDKKGGGGKGGRALPPDAASGSPI